jgi:pimeloyl-ACP methyl ester carboxylesterase
VPPEATRELASRIPGAIYREMPELGHFPHAENPEAFSQHLRWALDAIEQHKTSKTPQS